ncbi:TIGR01458 family HAD-type hydrolase [Marinobacterium lutimaris]|uniref:Haloacid dehalogenase-like hydrolase domain-containing protein 2 n=1 Tax=Marinobacterium lutimaris TaxID=568106 RepID=A0A1H5UTQ8_9GAMM|nr:TIGR01458 family HAD-type hydrolase [Marinobacterium lutimaris]SEF78455.1 HAD-superfamily subfamily IIA hydrolase, TIGR01458 [Marinobacterium lutimaris]
MSRHGRQRVSIQGLLLDLDGVLYSDDRLIEGAVASIDWLQSHAVPFRYITNTSTKTPQELQKRLRSLGLPATSENIFSAVQATEEWLRREGIKRIAPLVRASVEKMLAGDFEIDRLRPEAVVIGDIGEAWDYSLLQQAFQWLVDGARLVCVHRNRYSRVGDTLSLDIGAFVVALEYAAQAEAAVVGKPSAAFFHAACASFSLPPEQVAVVGDDIDADVGGGRAAGCLGILVETGKFRSDLVARSGIRPDFQIASIADLPELLSGASGR